MLAALTCVLAPIAIPMPLGVPITLATFSIMLAGVLLGARLGTISQGVYILLGAAGLPVFSGYRGGIGVIAGMTGGYIIGYLPLVFCSGCFYHRFGRTRKGTGRILAMVTGMLTGTALLYLLGTAWFIAVSHMSVSGALAACVLPFLPGDAVKIAAVVMLALPLERALRRAGWAE